MKLKTFLLLSIIAVFAVACKSGGGRGNVSGTTGWVLNDDKYGGFEVTDEDDYYNSRITPPGMVYVRGGTFTMGRISGSILSDNNNMPRRYTVSSFYMDQFEISNIDWREYVNWLKVVYRRMPGVAAKAMPDTTVWRRDLGFNEPFVQSYFRHVAYNHYPVVGVSWEQATDYCKWRTDRVNEKILADRRFLTLPNFELLDSIPQNAIADSIVFNTAKYLYSNQYRPRDRKGNIVPKTSWDEGFLLGEYRLPFEAEWEYAAYGILGAEDDENYVQRRIYPWDGHSMRNPAKDFRGQMMANYARGRGDMGGMASRPNDGYSATAPVDEFEPNDYGLFNMAGNVSEWVSDVYRDQTYLHTDEFNPYRGNMFMDIDWIYSTSNGISVKTPRLDSLGRVEYILNEDVRNAKDGDLHSNLDPSQITSGQSTTSAMYTLSGNNIEKLISGSISDSTRVYKGGGWRDRAYWLQPATRRFLSQENARDDLGFRCAMTYLGNDL